MFAQTAKFSPHFRSLPRERVSPADFMVACLNAGMTEQQAIIVTRISEVLSGSRPYWARIGDRMLMIDNRRIT